MIVNKKPMTLLTIGRGLWVFEMSNTGVIEI
nr:MAG TPA: hypothetical protein [Caudoviricetes sp.]